MSSVQQRVDNAIAQHKAVIFSKSWCPYCSRAKRTLKGVTEDLYIEELDQEDDGDEVQGYLQQKTGQRTVPNIFIAGEHIGGNSDLEKLGGSLKQRLR